MFQYLSDALTLVGSSFYLVSGFLLDGSLTLGALILSLISIRLILHYFIGGQFKDA